MAQHRLAQFGNDEAIRAGILEAARALVRRHGAAKVAVVDIARALGISHTSLYRHFPSKAELMDVLGTDAMTVDEALAVEMAGRDGPAVRRLEQLAVAIHLRKCERFRDDAEVHALYERVARRRPDLVRAYAERMTGALAAIVRQGVATGEFKADLDVATAAGAIRDSLAAFVHPVLVGAEGGRPAKARLLAVLRSIIAGLR